jgi:CRP-like cAMP-binding protein
VFHEADDGQAVHVLVKGRAAVRLLGTLGDSVLVDIVGVGDVIGELALVGHDASRAGTVSTLEPVETMSMSRPTFDEMRQTHPVLDRALLELVAERLRRMNARLVEAHHVAADLRVLRRLAELAKIYGATGDRSVDVPLTQADLADLAGTTRQTVSTVVTRAKAQGLLTTGRGRITIVDVDAVVRAAG